MNKTVEADLIPFTRINSNLIIDKVIKFLEDRRES
jgi:hypothetical protein